MVVVAAYVLSPTFTQCVVLHLALLTLPSLSKALVHTHYTYCISPAASAIYIVQTHLPSYVQAFR